MKGWGGKAQLAKVTKAINTGVLQDVITDLDVRWRSPCSVAPYVALTHCLGRQRYS